MTQVRRGSVVVAVLLLLAIGVVIAAGALVSADAAGAASQAEMTRTQARALAWSGVQAVMTELSDRRLGIISGEEPQVTAEWSLFELDDGSRGVVRLIDLDPEAPGVLASENAKLDINSATVETLARVPGLSAALAERIIEARNKGPFSSVEQLLGVEGIDAGLVYGAPERSVGYAPPLGETPAGHDGKLQGFLTVFSFDPNVQSGLGGDSDARGKLRVNIAQPWSEERHREVADRLGDQIAQALGVIMESGREFETSGALVQAMAGAGIPPEDWGLVLDVLTTEPGTFLTGRVDINHAPAEVLACLPGMTSEVAGRIVEARESLDPGARTSLAWPVVEEIVSREAFAGFAGSITTRSTQWRVRLEVGIERADPAEFGSSLGGAPPEPGSSPVSVDAVEAEPSLEHRMRFEAVIDIGSSRPRLAYLRDVTSLEPVLAALADRAGDPLEELAPDPLRGAENDRAGESDRSTQIPVLDGEPELDAGTEDKPSGEEAEQMPEGMLPAPAPAPENAEQAATTDSRIGRWSTRRAGNR